MASSQISGLGSGIDWQSTIDQLMAIEKRPLQMKQERKQKLEGKNSAWDAINGKVTALQNTLLSMDTMKELMIKSATSTDSEIITAKADENATTGSYSIDVKQLANAHKMISSGFPNYSGQIFSGPGTFTISGKSGHDTPPKAPESFDVTAATTLSDLKRLINANTDCDVTASIMNDGDPTNPYRLILTSKETGVNSEIHIGGTATLGAQFRDIAISAPETNQNNTGTAVMSTSGAIYSGKEDTFTFTALSPTSVEVKNSAGTVVSTLDLTGYTAGTNILIQNGMSVSFASPGTLATGDIFTVKTSDSTARDSIIEVENITITKDTNTITDVIEGVTLTLNKISGTTPEIINVTNDKEGVKALINRFIGDYNTVISTVKGYQKWDEELKTGGVLFGDGQAGSILQNFGILISSTNKGMNESQLYQTLSQVGIKIGADGRLSMDNTKFTDALNSNFEETIKLFTVDTNISGTDKNKFQFTSNTAYTHGGNYQVNATVVGGKITSATIGGEAVDISSNFITGKKGTTAEGLMININTDTDGTFTADLRFSAGKNQELISQIQQYVQTENANGTDGLVPLSKKGIASSIDNINKQIESMQIRLENTRKMMEKKWLAMEKYVSNMKNQSARNSAMNF